MIGADSRKYHQYVDDLLAGTIFHCRCNNNFRLVNLLCCLFFLNENFALFLRINPVHFSAVNELYCREISTLLKEQYFRVWIVNQEGERSLFCDLLNELDLFNYMCIETTEPPGWSFLLTEKSQLERFDNVHL